MSALPAPLLELRAASKRFVTTPDTAARVARLLGANAGEEIVHAVDAVDLAVQAGEVVGLVGESGCGKSTLGRLAIGLLAPSAGTRLWQGEVIALQTPQKQRAIQLKIQMIFQDPYASLNPRLRVADIVGEAPVVHGLVEARQRDEYVARLLARVGLDASLLGRFPHQFSGGPPAPHGRGRALAVKPEFLVCDEAVAALYVSIQAQVLNLFIKLREEFKLTYLFISHDLGVVQHLSDRVLIMYLGRVLEAAPTEQIYARANHPYTQGLLAEVPRLDWRRKRFISIKGEIPSPLAPPPGCHFHPRCAHAMPRCRIEQPLLREIAPLHFSACHLNDGVSS